MDSTGRRVLSLSLFLPFSHKHTRTRAYTRVRFQNSSSFSLYLRRDWNRPSWKRRNFFLPLNVSNSRKKSRDFSKIVNHLSTIVEIILPPGIFEELLFLQKGIKLDQVIIKASCWEKLLLHPYVMKCFIRPSY